jgi:Kef-type K+ transport system membrane component KefB
MHFTNLLIIVVVAFVAPLVVNAVPALRVPSPVLEIVAGIVVGPSLLGWVHVDAPVQVLALIGLAFLLFLAGLEIDVHKLRGRPLILALTGFVVSFAIAVGVALLLAAGGFASAPLLIAIILCSTSLGLVVPVLKDSGQVGGVTGQLIIAAASIADFGAVILLSLLFSEESTGLPARVLLLTGLALVAVLLAVALMRAGRSARAERVFAKLMDTTAQIRIRFATLLLVAFLALAQGLGFEAILGAFLAGAVLRLIDADAATVHPHTEVKLDAIGYGFLIPVFFVTSGVMFDAKALFASSSTLLQVPLFLAALFVVRALPALLYRPQLGMRRTMAAGFLQATSLPFIVAAVQIDRPGRHAHRPRPGLHPHPRPSPRLGQVALEPLDGGDPGRFGLGRVVARAGVVVKRVVHTGVDGDPVRTASAAQLLLDLVFRAGDPGVTLGIDGEYCGRGGGESGQVLRRRAVEGHRRLDLGTGREHVPGHATPEAETRDPEPVARAGGRQRSQRLLQVGHHRHGVLLA